MEGHFSKVEILFVFETKPNMTYSNGGVDRREFDECTLKIHGNNLFITTYKDKVTTTQVHNLDMIKSYRTHPYKHTNDPPEMEDEEEITSR